MEGGCPLISLCGVAKWAPTEHAAEGHRMNICILYADNRHVDNLDMLFLSMRERDARIIVHENGVEKLGRLQSIQREDGSGRSFNVTVLVGDEYNTYYVGEYENNPTRPRRGIRVFDSE